MTRTFLYRIPADPGFADKLAALARPAAPEPAQIEAIVNGVVATLSGDMSLADLQLYREVEALADYIRNARAEIAELRPDEIRDRHIPIATDELDAVVEATADATGTILTGMEQLEELARSLPPEAAAEVGAIVIRIYEACGFQDITGQRITKVVRALRHIESKIEALLALFGGEAAGSVVAPVEESRSEGDSAALLNGPELPASHGNSQADIDAILASFD